MTIEGYLRRWRVPGAIGAVLLAVGLLGVACGGDDSSGSTAATTSPEQKQSTDADGGSGLGLAIAREIVERHAGTIHVDAQHAPGARLIVELPLDG